jgi:hypothetical protein
VLLRFVQRQVFSPTSKSRVPAASGCAVFLICSSRECPLRSCLSGRSSLGLRAGFGFSLRRFSVRGPGSSCLGELGSYPTDRAASFPFSVLSLGAECLQSLPAVVVSVFPIAAEISPPSQCFCCRFVLPKMYSLHS